MNTILFKNMNEETIDIDAQEVVESPEVEPHSPFLNAKVNQKELKKVIKQYNRYRKSIFAEIRRLDNKEYDL